ncbi:hypothetical protein EXIGLDRAFT_720470 [Exidia glandulosa HHB12029]|uniref:Uncharacterized protein n=1 Tax=Exidia glandulosa HHB12029 TaxID=1314781 RepID=A0A165NKD1_EXIGL|nr:hypothetical protein EXIGLDRAFT_720470 [Exidia glandulosa HHB12029]
MTTSRLAFPDFRALAVFSHSVAFRKPSARITAAPLPRFPIRQVALHYGKLDAASSWRICHLATLTADQFPFVFTCDAAAREPDDAEDASPSLWAPPPAIWSAAAVFLVFW